MRVSQHNGTRLIAIVTIMGVGNVRLGVNHAGLSLPVSTPSMRRGSLCWCGGKRTAVLCPPTPPSLLGKGAGECGDGLESQACRSPGSSRQKNEGSGEAPRGEMLAQPPADQALSHWAWKPLPQTVAIIAIKQLTPITHQAERRQRLRGSLGFAYLNAD